MTKKAVRRTKACDNTMIRLNSIGISLTKIGELLDVHPTTVSGRLKILGIEPTYKTHAFMEDIIEKLPEETSAWLYEKCSRAYPIKDLIRTLLIKAQEEDSNESATDS